MAELQKYAHYFNGVVYSINESENDHKAENEVRLGYDNCPHLKITLTKVDNSGLTNNGNYIIDLSHLVEEGDSYDAENNQFVINNDKYGESDDRRIDSYFEYQQYLNEQEAVKKIISGELTCENAIQSLPFYYQAQSGQIDLREIKNEYNITTLPNTEKFGLYNYSVEIRNDGDGSYHDFNTDDALFEEATNAANLILNKCGYSLNDIISTDDITSTDDNE